MGGDVKAQVSRAPAIVVLISGVHGTVRRVGAGQHDAIHDGVVGPEREVRLYQTVRLRTGGYETVEEIFPNGWEAILEGSGFILPPLAGQVVSERTGSGTPVLAAAALLGGAMSRRVYCGLTGIGPSASLREREGWHVPWQEDDDFFRLGFRGEVHGSMDGVYRALLVDTPIGSAGVLEHRSG